MLSPKTVLRNTGRRIGELRRQAGRTQAEVAEELGFSTKYQQLIESGTENLTLESLVRFANYFKIEPAKLLHVPRSTRPGRGRPGHRES